MHFIKYFLAFFSTCSKRVLVVTLTALMVLCSNFSLKATSHWAGTWGAAPQLVEPNNMPPAPGLSGNTLRQVVRVSIGGKDVRLKLSNQYGSTAMTLRSVQLALFTGGSSIDAKSGKLLTFGGKREVTLLPGESIVSDPIRFRLKARSDVAVTICFGKVPTELTGHPGSRTTSFLVSGDEAFVPDFGKAVSTDHWYVIQGIEVLASVKCASVVIIGNSITDGRGSETNRQNRWPDILAERLLNNSSTKNVGVLNMGIGGNCVLRGGLGPTALNRFDRDVLGQAGVRWVVVFIGVNDIGGIRPDSLETAEKTAQRLIKAYGQFIDKAHAKGIKIYGGTIMPFRKNGYYTVNREVCRNMVNEWIRTSDQYDAVIDFDRIMRDPAEPDCLPAHLVFQNDFLHPNVPGHRKMGEAIDLNLFGQ
jgi:lysophospholipase L1-like esterase